MQQHTKPQAESNVVDSEDPSSSSEPAHAADNTSGRQTGDVVVTWPRPSVPRPVVAVLALVLLLVIALGSWQVVSLRHQVHQLQHVTQNEEQQLGAQRKQLSTLKSSVSAAVGCLESPQAPPGLCLHFLR